MVKSVLGVNHSGLRDWLIQRITAVVMTVYSIGIIIYFVMNPDLSFNNWHFLFTHLWMKVATLLFIVSLLFHAWIGMWTVFTDYVHPYWLRLIIYILGKKANKPSLLPLTLIYYGT